ncbi:MULTISPECIES: ABC transporter substrate-binding protein [unclassified Microbacterium]|uniref:ABC transporter substrate-binding protein n=1 Tax=unclassified Microbacterium TaxID=2609290 RepID=UPI000CFB39BD|nr:MULTISPECIES: ABC transporter substrate-binding protein [unclassified Microbacterium]PQZ55659.1 glycine/betaine ABC transporter [Microbacterium sp. MYb43]PQZ80991.1 glycine/betaine ABC transporter [Microbacterium sp. MYb40]PRB20823.1 glycine/betaine ABC transporter [Microbacterium sp. MYb54]PRB31884.1 glycine/betaine ABC transporter [Microbacterium sp. MYb50]PRB64500.1 glycine/betaine ABC transporter [Microbacterium sp. MYb24]
MFTARKSRLALAGGAALAAVLVLGGCANSNPLDAPSEDSSSAGDTIVIGSQAYYSNEIIAEIYAQALEGAGFKVDKQFNIGQRDAYMPDVESGAIDLFPEYTGNLLEYLDKDATATSPDDVYAALKEALPKGLTALDYAEASDQDTYTVLKSFAEENGLTSIGDLSKITTPVTIGAAPEFEQRPYGPAAAKEVYGVDLGFSATGPTTLESLLAGEIQVADIYSADPAFQTEDIVALEDPENIILASNVVPIVSSDVADEISDVINAVSKKLTAEELVGLNVQSTVDQKSAEDIAKKWLADNDLS